MEKSYRIVVAGNFHDCCIVTKVDYIVSSSSKKNAVEQISKRYENVWSINVKLMLIRTIKSIFKFNKI